MSHHPTPRPRADQPTVPFRAVRIDEEVAADEYRLLCLWANLRRCRDSRLAVAAQRELRRRHGISICTTGPRTPKGGRA